MKLKKGWVFAFAILIGLIFVLGQSMGKPLYAKDRDKFEDRRHKSNKSHKVCKRDRRCPRICVLNPVADFEVPRIVPVERPADLNNKMIVLYWNAKLNSNNIVDEVRLKLQEIYPTSNFAIVQGSAWMPMPGFYDEILALEPDVVISSTAD